jgi:hypothetical protein
MAELSPNVTKFATLAAAALAGLLAQKIVAAIWQKASGHQLPKADEDFESHIVEVIAAAAVSGAVMGLARAGATRAAYKTASHFSSSTPEQLAGVEPV